MTYKDLLIITLIFSLIAVIYHVYISSKKEEKNQPPVPVSSSAMSTTSTPSDSTLVYDNEPEIIYVDGSPYPYPYYDCPYGINCAHGFPCPYGGNCQYRRGGRWNSGRRYPGRIRSSPSSPPRVSRSPPRVSPAQVYRSPRSSRSVISKPGRRSSPRTRSASPKRISRGRR